MDSLFGLERLASHDEALAHLITVYDPSLLPILESILRDAEIPYLKKERGSGSSVKIITGFSLFGTDLFVLKEHLEVATALITPPESVKETETDEEEADD